MKSNQIFKFSVFGIFFDKLIFYGVTGTKMWYLNVSEGNNVIDRLFNGFFRNYRKG